MYRLKCVLDKGTPYKYDRHNDKPGDCTALREVHQLHSSLHMMTSSNGNIFRLTGPWAGNSPVIDEFPSQKLVKWSVDVFFDLRHLNKRLCTQSRHRWTETPSRSLWHHCNDIYSCSNSVVRTSGNPSKATFTHARSGCGADTGGFWHSRYATAGMFRHTRSGRGRIWHFLRTKMVWGARFRSGRGKLGVGPISWGADFAPAPPPLRDRACVNACDDLCWSQFSARLRSAHVWTYLDGEHNHTTRPHCKMNW